jgi:uncharacterized membrane protein YccC
MQALLGTIAALCALAAAMFLKLENPYWAAMTALIVIQPTRGMLFEKSVYRLLGTAIGAVAGMGLLLYTRSPLLLTLALALWLSACVGIGNLLHGQRSYAALMAACTCAIIAMSGYQDPPHLHAIALGRIACIIIGILAATLITALFTPHNPKEELFRRLHQLSGKTVAWLALHLRQGPAGTLIRQEQNILIEIAELEGMLDASCAGRRGSRQRKRHLRGLLAALLSLLAIGRLTGTQLSHHNKQDRRHDYWQGMLAGHLEVVADRLERAETIGCTEEMAAVVAETKAHLPLLGKNLAEIVNVLTLLLHDYSSMTSSTAEPARNRLIRHRDWQEARRAAIRAGLGIALTGLVWSLTGWSKGPLMLMAVSIMISIFSNKEHPARFVGQIFIGAAIGSALAVFCRAVLLPGVTDPALIAATISPFVMLGVFAMQYRRTAVAATDATLFFIFIAQPGVSIAILPADLAIGALAMVAGVGSSWLAYRYLIPINPAIRLRRLLIAIARDSAGLAASESPLKTEISLLRMQHRVIRLVAMATRYATDHLSMVEGGLAALSIGSCVQRLTELQRHGELSETASAQVRSTLLALAKTVSQPDSIKIALEESSLRLYAILGQSLQDNMMVPEVRATPDQTVDHAEDTRYSGHAGGHHVILAIQSA